MFNSIVIPIAATLIAGYKAGKDVTVVGPFSISVENEEWVYIAREGQPRKVLGWHEDACGVIINEDDVRRYVEGVLCKLERDYIRLQLAWNAVHDDEDVFDEDLLEHLKDAEKALNLAMDPNFQSGDTYKVPGKQGVWTTLFRLIQSNGEDTKWVRVRK